jgi:light-regulated signal transduction histidine kinase (bacteriophytochrome)
MSRMSERTSDEQPDSAAAAAGESIHHDLRNRLHNLGLRVAVLARRYEGVVDAEDLEKIRAEIRAAANLVEQLERK